MTLATAQDVVPTLAEQHIVTGTAVCAIVSWAPAQITSFPRPDLMASLPPRATITSSPDVADRVRPGAIHDRGWSAFARSGRGAQAPTA